MTEMTIPVNDDDGEDVEVEYIDVDNPKCIHNARCSSGHIVSVNLDNLDSNDVGGFFYVPCPICGKPVIIKDEYVMNAFDMTKDEVKIYRSKLANEKRNKNADDLVPSGDSYNPQGDDVHGNMERIDDDDDDDDDDYLDTNVEFDGNPLDEIYPTSVRDVPAKKNRMPVVTSDGNINMAANANSGKSDGDAKLFAKFMEFMKGYKDVNVISPQSDNMEANMKITAVGNNVTDDIDLSSEDEIDPKLILKKVIRGSKVNADIKSDILEHIDLKSEWSIQEVVELLESYGVSSATAVKISKHYEVLLEKENLKRNNTIRRIGLLNSSDGLNMVNVGDAISNAIRNGMSPQQAVVTTQNVALNQKLTNIVSKSDESVAGVASQLSGITTQMDSIANTPNVNDEALGALTQMQEMIEKVVDYMDHVSNNKQSLNGSEFMSLGQIIGQMQQQLNAISVQSQGAVGNSMDSPGNTRTTPIHRRYYDRRYPEYEDEADMGADMDRYSAIRRRRTREDTGSRGLKEDDIKNIVAEQMKDVKDSFATAMKMMMQQQYMQQAQGASPSSVNDELKEVKEALLALAQGNEEAQRDASVEEIREMKEMFMSYLQAQQQQQMESQKKHENEEIQEMKNLVQELIKAQSQPVQPKEDTDKQILLEMIRGMQNKPKDDGNDKMYGLILEMIRGMQSVNNTPKQNEELREMMQLIREMSIQNKGSPDPRDVQQQELFNKLFERALNPPDNQQNDYLVSMLMQKMDELKSPSVPPAQRPVSIEELKHDLELTRLRNDIDIKKRELDDKHENREFLKEMVNNSFKKIGETVGAVIAGGALNNMQAPQQHEVQPYADANSEVMAIPCQSCGTAIYVPYGMTTAICPQCGTKHQLDFGNTDVGSSVPTSLPSVDQSFVPSSPVMAPVETSPSPTMTPTSAPVSPINDSPIQVDTSKDALMTELNRRSQDIRRKVTTSDYNGDVFNTRQFASPSVDLPVKDVPMPSVVDAVTESVDTNVDDSIVDIKMEESIEKKDDKVNKTKESLNIEDVKETPKATSKVEDVKKTSEKEVKKETSKKGSSKTGGKKTSGRKKSKTTPDNDVNTKGDN